MEFWNSVPHDVNGICQMITSQCTRDEALALAQNVLEQEDLGRVIFATCMQVIRGEK